VSGGAHPPGDDEPTSRRIALEIALYALLVIVVGAAFVAVRVAREGTRVLTVDPHAGSQDHR
jgi:hypothetical protein